MKQHAPRTCEICGSTFERKPGAGRPPRFCPDCREGSGYAPEQYAEPQPEHERRASRPTFGSHPLVQDREPGRARSQAERGMGGVIRASHLA